MLVVRLKIPDKAELVVECAEHVDKEEEFPSTSDNLSYNEECSLERPDGCCKPAWKNNEFFKSFQPAPCPLDGVREAQQKLPKTTICGLTDI